ncbi:MAG TPA: sulfotransferase domain-containing protein [Steroidobacteraceae bacterium]|nr:sulfotransferase domain-containing protein [Steroidobacteraceae bacterium]
MKEREVRTRIIDSTRWNELALRASDIIVASWGKSGTTLLVQMVAQLLSGGTAGVGVKAPWVEALPFAPREKMIAAVRALPDPRVLKTHLPFDALVFSEDARYLYVGRDPRDVVWSAYNHHASLTPGSIESFNSSGGTGPLVRPCQGSVRDYYLHWLEHDELPGFTLNEPFWAHVRGWWEQRHRPNVLLLHHAKIIAELAGQMRRIAAFLGLQVDERALPAMLAHCRIDYMREHAATLPAFTRIFERGARSFFHHGTNGRWKGVLTPEESARCEMRAARELPPACAHWLMTGELPP